MFLVITINLITNDLTFEKKNYQKKYHYQNKIKEGRNKFKLVLSEEEQCKLCKKLVEINDEKLFILNKKLLSN